MAAEHRSCCLLFPRVCKVSQTMQPKRFVWRTPASTGSRGLKTKSPGFRFTWGVNDKKGLDQGLESCGVAEGLTPRTVGRFADSSLQHPKRACLRPGEESFWASHFLHLLGHWSEQRSPQLCAYSFPNV